MVVKIATWIIKLNAYTILTTPTAFIPDEDRIWVGMAESSRYIVDTLESSDFIIPAKL